MLKTTACVLALFASVPAAAGSSPVTQSETVRFDDLNLANPAGVGKLERRLEAAARRVCGFEEARTYGWIVRAQAANCMAGALASARQQVALKTGAIILKG